MGDFKRIFPIMATMIIASMTVAGLAVSRGRDDGRGVRIVALPASVAESSVLGALSAAGVDGAVASSTAIVPLSDFSRVVAVAFQGADLRAPSGDPRRTPLLDELERRFSVAGPDGALWRVLYLPGSNRARDAAVAGALDGLGTPWAWDLAPGAGPFLALPALAWAFWLVARRPGRGRLGRTMLALAWFPLLPGATLARCLLFVTLEAATMTADSLIPALPRTRARRSRLALALWPYVAAAAAILAMEPGSSIFLAISVASLFVLTYLRPRTLRWAGGLSPHAPPAFRSLTPVGAYRNARGIARGLPLPVAALLAAYALAPASMDGDIAGAFSLELGPRRSGSYAEALMARHLDYQYAVTFGRIGDVSWGDDSYDQAYRYREEGGRMRLDDAPGERRDDWPPGTFRSAEMALTFHEPLSVRAGGRK